MATQDITITISTSSIQEAVRLYSTYFGYSSTLPDGSANPEARAAFCKRIIARNIQTAIKQQLQKEADAALTTDITVT